VVLSDTLRLRVTVLMQTDAVAKYVKKNTVPNATAADF